MENVDWCTFLNEIEISLQYMVINNDFFSGIFSVCKCVIVFVSYEKGTIALGKNKYNVLFFVIS